MTELMLDNLRGEMEILSQYGSCHGAESVTAHLFLRNTHGSQCSVEGTVADCFRFPPGLKLGNKSCVFKLIRQWLYDFLAVILIGNGLMIGLYSLGLRHCPPNLIFSWGTLKVLLLISTLVAGFLIFLIERPLYRSYSPSSRRSCLRTLFGNS